MSTEAVAKYVTAIRKLDTWECACPFTCSELEMYPDSLHYAPDRCVINYLKEGSEGEKAGSLGLAWFAAVLSIFMFIFYTWQFYTSTCGWEVVFVSIMEGLYYVADIFFHDQIPFTLFLADGATVPMVRYTEWLLTCPVLLIHLSNITGLQDEYSPRTMKVLTADQGTLIFGILAAMSSKGLKIFFFLCGATFGVTTFYTAAQIYIEAYYQVPKGQPQKAVRWMTWSYFMSWPLFPVFFLAGPVGFGHLNKHGDSIAHAIIDMLSKNLWGILGWYLRYTIHVHIAMNGHHTKRVRTMIMGQEKEISVFAEEGEHDAVTHSSRALTTRRKSIERLARQLRAKGKKTRTSLDLDDEETNGGWQAGQKSAPRSFRGNPRQELPSEALVVVATMDEELGNFFIRELGKLKSKVQVEIVRSDEEAAQCLDYFRQNGPVVNMVLVQPSLAQQYPDVVSTIKSYGAPAVLFASSAQQRGALGADDYIPGPSFGQNFDSAVLGSLLVKFNKK